MAIVGLAYHRQQLAHEMCGGGHESVAWEPSLCHECGKGTHNPG